MEERRAKRLFWRTSGANDGRTVVLLHGFLGSSDDWSRIAPHVPTVRLVCVDLPGHGRSTHLPPSAYSFNGFVEALDHVLEELQVSEVDLVGYSMGGRLALTYAIMRPDRCRSLLLESASPGIEPPADREERLRVDAERAAALRSTSLEEFLREWYRQPLFASLAEREDFFERLIEVRSGANRLSLAQALGAFSPGRQPSWWSELAGLDVPITFVAGARDVKYVEIGRRVEETAVRATLSVVEEVGHNVHLERPEAYLRLVLDHLEATS